MYKKTTISVEVLKYWQHTSIVIVDNIFVAMTPKRFLSVSYGLVTSTHIAFLVGYFSVYKYSNLSVYSEKGSKCQTELIFIKGRKARDLN